MRVINEKHEAITEYDLSLGFLIPVTAVRENAEPIDNKTKFAWSDEDYEDVQMYMENPVKTAAERIEELKQKLRETDYHIIKTVEGAATLSQCAEVIKQRAEWRKEINRLEQE